MHVYNKLEEWNTVSCSLGITISGITGHNLLRLAGFSTSFLSTVWRSATQVLAVLVYCF